MIPAGARCGEGMPDESQVPGVYQAAHRYVIYDPETKGIYQLVVAAPKTQADVNAIVASVIEDEGRVAAGVTRSIYL
jgi:hypothetical protein